MATKTARILSYLPGTFRRAPQLSALYAVTDAFGRELLQAENSLAAVMQAHWVDHADRGADEIADLARIAAMYGLSPRPDESVEEFREHLKRYVRTFLEGTVTVQGILRVTAEALGLHIADVYEEMDTWWNRDDDALTTIEPRADDAAQYLLGFNFAAASGRTAQPAQVWGTVDLSDGLELPETAFLRLKVDDIGPEEINLATGADDLSNVTLAEMVAQINEEMGTTVADHNGRFLTLTATTAGPDSRIELQYVDDDVTEQVLGLAPRTYRGRAPQAATVTGTEDLSEGIDLGEDWYLRLTVDGLYLAEIDCAGFDPSHVTLDQLRDAINEDLGIEAASHDGRFLTLTSPTTGSGSSILFQRPAAQEATASIFGSVSAYYAGRDEQPARLAGRRDLSQGVDLSQRANVQLQIDGMASVTINCAGTTPDNTRLFEIVNAINDSFGDVVANHDGRFITITSPTRGAGSEIILGIPPEEDATEDIFGIGPRIFAGKAAAQARLLGQRDLSAGVDLTARHLLKIARDGGPPQEIDLRAGVADLTAVTLNELAETINNALGDDVATHDGQHLILITPELGSARSLVVEPMTTIHRRRFVTRAMITDEAAPAIFGFLRRQAQGTAATHARLVGKKDLSRSVDLRQQRYLRLAIDDHPAIDIDCAGLRPYVTTLEEVVAAINKAVRTRILPLKDKLDALGLEVAAHDGRHLVLISPSLGGSSRIALETPRATDALSRLLNVEPGAVRGQDATRVRFVSTVDLSGGLDLSAADRIKLGVDGADPVEIACAGADPAQTKLGEIVKAINVALDQVIASQDGTTIILTSPTTGQASQLVFETPDGADATAAIFGFAPPRTYHGADATPAQITGSRDLSQGANLETTRFLRLAVDGREPIVVDCAALAAQPTTASLGEIVAAINEALEAEVASHDGTFLILTSPTPGAAGRLALEPHLYPEGEGRELLLGEVTAVTEGIAPTPAVLTGTVDLLAPVDLSQRRLIRLAVDGGRMHDIDVAGPIPATTFLDEIIAAINAVFPDLASATEDDRLQLTSPTSGTTSSLSLQPLRYLEVIEYPLEPIVPSPQDVKHGDVWTVSNDGAADVYIEARFTAPQGSVGPTLENMALGWHIRLLTPLTAGETARVWRDPERGLQAAITAANGEVRPIPGDAILVGPPGSQVWTPFTGQWSLSGDEDGQELATLQLNNPPAPGIVLLRARPTITPGRAITVAVSEHDFTLDRSLLAVADGATVTLIGRLRAADGAYHLADEAENVVAALWPGPTVTLAAYQDCVVAVTGPLHTGSPPVLIVQTLTRRFDVRLRFSPQEGEAIEELYESVSIGHGRQRPDSLVWQINSGPHFSALVKAEEWDKDTVLYLPRGRSAWRYRDCFSYRFNQAYFDSAVFAGGVCGDRGVFNVSRFARRQPPEPVTAVFASSGPLLDPAATVVFHWQRHRPGAFTVNLPLDLPPRFGGRFNQARFSQQEGTPELFPAVVTQRTGDEPFDEQHYIIELINSGGSETPPSTLVEASKTTFVPQGWQPVAMPFREPQHLTLGATTAAARIYLFDEELDGFILLQAKEVGTWGNEIAVTARQAGPAMYDVAIIYEGGRFDKARQTAQGPDLPALMQEILKPGPIGVLQAKAAGVRADVSRKRT